MNRKIKFQNFFVTILLHPLIISGKFYKGVLWVWRPQVLLEKHPGIKKYFIVISMTAWRGWSHASCEDIHALATASEIEEFKKEFPNGTHTVLQDADFISEDEFHPIDAGKEYDIIFISRMAFFKRHQLFLKILYNTRKQYRRNLKVIVITGFYGKKPISISNFFKDPLNPKQTYRNIREELYPYVMNILYEKAIKDGLNITLITKNQTNETLRALYNKSKMYLLLSLWEGTNRVAKEAMFCDVPVMVMKNTPAEETHINRHTGKAVTDDPEVITKEILNMVDNYKAYSPRKWALSHRPRRYACEKIWEAINKIQKYPGFPDMNSANNIRKQFTKNPYDNYLDMNNYNGRGRWKSEEEIPKIMSEFKGFL